MGRVVEVGLRGIVFRLLEQAVVDEHGEEMWDTLLDVAQVSGAYTSLGVYDDSELMALAADVTLCLEAGMDDYLAKPIDAIELAAALERAPADGPARSRCHHDGASDRFVAAPVVRHRLQIATVRPVTVTTCPSGPETPHRLPSNTSAATN
jgi:hypothetical protein